MLLICHFRHYMADSYKKTHIICKALFFFLHMPKLHSISYKLFSFLSQVYWQFPRNYIPHISSYKKSPVAYLAVQTQLFSDIPYLIQLVRFFLQYFLFQRFSLTFPVELHQGKQDLSFFFDRF